MKIIRCFIFGLVITSNVLLADEIKFSTTEKLHSKILPNMLTPFYVSPDGRHVAYTVGAGRYFPPLDESDSESWESQVIVIDGKRSKPNTGISGFLFSPDSKRYGYISKHYSGYQFVVVDGVESENYGSKGKTDDNRQIRDIYQLTFSPNSKSYAYVAASGSADGLSYIVLNGEKQKAYKSVSGPTFSPDSTKLAYCAEAKEVGAKNEGKSLVVINGQESKKYHSVSCDNPNPFVFSDDSQHYAYLASEDYSNGKQKKCLLIIDGKEQEVCSDPRNVMFKPSGNHLIKSPPKPSPVLNNLKVNNAPLTVSDVVSKKYGEILEYASSQDGATVVYVIRKNNKWSVVVNGNESKKYDFIFAKNAIYKSEHVEPIGNSSTLKFDTNRSFRYLAIRANKIYLVKTTVTQ